MVQVREECPYKTLNKKQERGCSDSNLCPHCWMDKDVDENKEMYEAMAVDLEDNE